jgi:transcriptional regulator with XRE-family HTH domain
MSNDAEIVGKRIRTLREAKAWTQADFAARVGVGRQQVVRWENGRDMPRIHLRQTVAKQLDQCPEVLFYVGANRDAAMEDAALAKMLEISRNANASPTQQLAAAKELRPKPASAKARNNDMAAFRLMMEKADAELTALLAELDATEA